MFSTINLNCRFPYTWKDRRTLSSIKNGFTLFLVSLLFFSLKTYGQAAGVGGAANLDQVRNGSATSPTTPGDFQNGNAGPSNAHFAEGYSIPYRMRIDGLSGTPSTVNTLIIEWDTKDQNGHAIDYITHYQNLNNPVGSHQATFGHAQETIDPTVGTSFTGAPSLFPIPLPTLFATSEVVGQPRASFVALPTAAYTNNPDITKMAIWGGTILSITYGTATDPEQSPDATTASTKTQAVIRFTSANASTALLAWGGHIAAEYDWGAGRGATGVSGSPYHMRLISINGGGGNQDRSLKASAVIIPPPLCGISPAQLACPETASLTFTAAGSSTGLGISYVWTITNNTANAMISGSNTGFSITVTPNPATGDFTPGGSFGLSLTVNKTGATPTTCTRNPAGTIQNVVVNASASPTLIDITSAAHNTTLTANIGAGSTDLNNANYGYQWTIVTAGTAGSLTNATSRIATYTAGVLDAGSTIQFRVRATQTAAPNCFDEEVVSISVNTVGPCDVSPQAAVCQGTTTTHTGSPNPKPATATYTWSLQGYGGTGTTTSTLVGGNSGTPTQQVVANQRYRIVLSQAYENTAVSTSCFEDVEVVPTPTVSAIYDPPSCTQNTFSIRVPNSVTGSSYRVTQGGEVTPTYSQTQPGVNGTTLTFSGLAAGGGFLVRVTTGTASCTATTDCAGSTNSCTNAATTQVTAKETMVANPAESYKIALGSPTKVVGVPNPFTDKIRFSLVSAISGRASLELYNMLGQQVGVVFEGYVDAGREFIKDYNVPTRNRNTLIYVFKVGDQKVTGKLIGLK